MVRIALLVRVIGYRAPWEGTLETDVLSKSDAYLSNDELFHKTTDTFLLAGSMSSMSDVAI